MVAIFPGSLATVTPITLEDFVAFVRSEADLYSYQGMIELVPYLRALAANKDLIQSVMRNEFQKVLSRKPAIDSFYGANTLNLHDDEKFYLRFNFWLPESEFSPGIEKFFAYDLAHDHNFDFLTVGCFGPGYRTSLYEYDASRVQGFAGEQVALKYVGEEILTPGKVMLYHRSVDVHTQWAPELLTGSLNLIVKIPKGRLDRQYLFDLKTSKILNTINLNYREYVLNTVSAIGDKESYDLARELCEVTACDRTQTAARNAVSLLSRRLSLANQNAPR